MSVLAFISSEHPDAPIKKLFDFQRIFLNPGQDEVVSFSMPAHMLSLVDKRGHQRVLPGSYRIRVSTVLGKVVTELVGSLSVTGQPRTIFDMEKAKEAYAIKQVR